MNLGRIEQVAIPVRDLARATAFYRDQLGMKLLFDENLSPKLPRLVASAFPDSQHVRELGGSGKTDGRNRKIKIMFSRIRISLTGWRSGFWLGPRPAPRWRQSWKGSWICRLCRRGNKTYKPSFLAVLWPTQLN